MHPSIEKLSRTPITILALVVVLCCTTALSRMSAQNMNIGFGKNRVQYHRHFDEWQYYETQHFTTYWYGDARNVAITALQIAEVDYAEIQHLLEHQLMDRVELLVFNDLTDLKQSNIGSEELFQLQQGETKVVGNKIFIYFDGDHRHLRAGIREGMSGVMINSMLYGSNLQEIVQNAVLLNLPKWYMDGLTAYCGESWNTETDQELRTLLQSGKYKTFDKLAKRHPRLAGHAFWNYISIQFGSGAVSNLLYLTRINRGIDAGLRYVIGNGYERTSTSILDFYNNRYKEDQRVFQKEDTNDLVKIKNKRKHNLYQFKISRDGRYLAWVQNDHGKWRVWQQDLRSGKRKRLLKSGVRNLQQATDYQYPLLFWHPDNQQLAIIYERRDIPKLALIDVKTGKKTTTPISPEFQRIYSADFINPVDLVVSAEVRGLTDLFIYRTVSRQTERITQDFWDDLDVRCVTIDGHKSVLFSSNRTADTLSQQRLDTIVPLNNFDLFLYDLETRSSELIRLTDTKYGDEGQPLLIDSAQFAFISDANGIKNRGIGHLEPYTAYYKKVFYLKNGSEVSSFDSDLLGEWPHERVADRLALADSVFRNLDTLLIDSIRSFPVFKKRAVTAMITNYNSPLFSHDLSFSSNNALGIEVFKKNDKTFVYKRKGIDFAAQQSQYTPLPLSKYREGVLREAGIALPATTRTDSIAAQPIIVKDSTEMLQPGWLFQMPNYLQPPPPTQPTRDLDGEPETRLDPEISEDDLSRNNDFLIQRAKLLTKVPIKKPAVQRFNPAKIVPYRLKFRTDFVSTTMDNSLLFEGLNSFAGSPNTFRTPPPGVLVRANFKELLEDYVIETGFRLPTSFNGSEYYIWLENRKRRLDRRYALYRQTIVNTVDNGRPGFPSSPYQVRTNTLLGQYELRYPLDPFFSLRAMATVRQDKALTLTSDRATLEVPDYAEQRAALRLSAVYDNTVDVDINLRTGTRARFFVEAVKRFELNSDPNWSLRLNSGFMTVFNLDARHYQMLDRRSILAIRLSGATTFGSERILYYLGGVDNWIFPKFNQNIPVPQNENFAYETLAAHLRGFRQNIRNGSSYGLINTELRIPIFKYLSRRPVLGNFWRNFQIVGFFDAGTAWSGRNPYSGDNPINIVYLESPPTVSVRVNYFRDPIVAGYGVGLRAPIFGMYIRADYGWGIETRVIQRPILHLALGSDF